MELIFFFDKTFYFIYVSVFGKEDRNKVSLQQQGCDAI